MIRLYCRFPDEPTAVMVAEALLGREITPDEDGVKRFSPDGWFAREGAEPIYWNIDVCFGTGVIHDADGNALPGYHVNGLWQGDDDTLPDALRQFMMFPEHPSVVFG